MLNLKQIINVIPYYCNNSTTVVVNVTAKDDSTNPTTPTDTSTPDVPSNQTIKEVKMVMDNGFDQEKYPNTVLVGTNAYVTVQLVDEDGKPVANKEVELTSKRIWPTGSMTDSWDNLSMFGNVSESVKKTDAKGNVTFVYGLDKLVDKNKKVIDATNDDFRASFKLTASVVGDTEKKNSIDVKFATLTKGISSNGITIKNLDTKSGFPALKLGVNTSGSAAASTIDRNEQPVSYVRSQQVSEKGKDTHRVAFDSGIGSISLRLPGVESGSDEAERIIEEINWSTERYKTYSRPAGGWILKGVSASKLQYATVNFEKLRLSKYSRFLVRAYIINDKDKDPTAAGNVKSIIDLTNGGTNEARANGPRSEDNFSVQIPVSTDGGYLYVTAEIESKGQVNTDLNEGFTVKNIEGVKKPGSTSIAVPASVGLSGLEIEWKRVDDVSYSFPQQLISGYIYTKVLADRNDPNATKHFTVWYEMPAFPATGNAIIKVRDDAGKNVAYYAAPTVNETSGSTVEGEKYRNRNILVDDLATLYQISEEEATRRNIGDIIQNGNIVVVNSESSGITHLEGTIKSSNADIKIDDSNSKIYTSIHWNPVENAGSSDSTKTGVYGAAFVGQNLVLRAQLTDKNGNVVSTSGVPVEFYKNKAVNGSSDKLTATGQSVGDASVVKVDTETNPLGQAELVLNSGKPAQALDIVAKAGNNDFDVTYSLGGQTVNGDWVDLYWVDANIKFEPGYGAKCSEVYTTLAQPVLETKQSDAKDDVNPTVGENWTYEVKTSGQVRDGGNQGTLKDYNTVEISGLTPLTSVGTGSVGSVTNADGGKADATSTKAGYTNIVNELNNNSLGKDIKLTFKNGTASKEVPYAGEGAATLSKKLTINVNWNHSVPTVDFIIPTGRKIDAGTAIVKVYVEVKDANGNPIDGRTVILEKTGAGAIAAVADPAVPNGIGTNNGNPTAKTNSEGIATFAITGTHVASETTTLVATVDGITGITQTNIDWITPSPGFKIEKAEYDYVAKTIKLTFSNTVSAGSINKDVFKVEYTPDGTDDTKFVKQIVTAMDSSGREVTISVPALQQVDLKGKFKVTIQSAIDSKTNIEYNLVSIDGQKLASGADGDVITFDADGYTAPTPTPVTP